IIASQAARRDAVCDILASSTYVSALVVDANTAGNSAYVRVQVVADERQEKRGEFRPRSEAELGRDGSPDVRRARRGRADFRFRPGFEEPVHAGAQQESP